MPAQLAAEKNKRGEVCASSIYFAIQGLFETISASLATQVILVWIRTFAVSGGGETGPLMKFFPLFVSGFCILAFVLAFFLPKSIALIGKETKENE